MTQQINIQIPAQALSVPLAALLSLIAAEPADAPSLTLPAPFGAELQGGIYAGPHWEDGKLIHLIAANESLGDKEWDDAKTIADDYRGGGFADWFLPSREQLEIARIYAQGKFEKVWHWTSTPYGQSSAWFVDFKYGDARISYRSLEFRVRPFRRLSI